VVPSPSIVDQTVAASAGPLDNQKAKLITLYLSAGAVPGMAKELPIELPQYDDIPSMYVTYLGPVRLNLVSLMEVLVDGMVVLVDGMVVLVEGIVVLVEGMGVVPGVPELAKLLTKVPTNPPSFLYYQVMIPPFQPRLAKPYEAIEARAEAVTYPVLVASEGVQGLPITILWRGTP